VIRKKHSFWTTVNLTGLRPIWFTPPRPYRLIVLPVERPVLLFLNSVASSSLWSLGRDNDRSRGQHPQIYSYMYHQVEYISKNRPIDGTSLHILNVDIRQVYYRLEIESFYEKHLCVEVLQYLELPWNSDSAVVARTPCEVNHQLILTIVTSRCLSWC
jgi:hypothetical protein